ncbi:MAG: hypothetical protein WCJ35_23240 [Planctomycetota bacterium]
MPLKTNIGVSRKVADNNYGSRGANVNLEVELDSTLINEPDRFHDRIRQVFRLAQQVIDEELTRQQADGTASQTTNGANGHTQQNGSNGNGNDHATNGNGNSHASNGNGHTATTISEKQVGYARQLAKQIDGFGVRRLENLAQQMFGKPMVALTTLDGSGLIDSLKAIKEGRINLDTVLNGAA